MPQRHASAAHYTAREDIIRVVGPTIVQPWRERINVAFINKATQRNPQRPRGLPRARSRMREWQLSLASRLVEPYRLETVLLVRIHGVFFIAVRQQKRKNRISLDLEHSRQEFLRHRHQRKRRRASEDHAELRQENRIPGAKSDCAGGVRTRILRSGPVAAIWTILTRTLRARTRCSLKWHGFRCERGETPPFLGGTRVRQEVGEHYVAKLTDRLGKARGELCALWFQLAHIKTQRWRTCRTHWIKRDPIRNRPSIEP